MKNFLMTTLVVALTTLSACSVTLCNNRSDNSPQVETTRAIAPFHTLKIKSSIDTYYAYASEPSVKIVAPQNLIDKVITRIENGTLSIYVDKKSYRTNKPIKVYVSAPMFSRLYIMGSGDFKAQNIDTKEDFLAEINGSGDIEIAQVSCNNAQVNVCGSGDVEIDKLSCDKGAIDIAGSGDAEVNFNQARQVTINIAGSGDVSSALNACGQVSCNVAGSGDVVLSGSAQSLSKHIKGSGDVHTRKLQVAQ